MINANHNHNPLLYNLIQSRAELIRGYKKYPKISANHQWIFNSEKPD